MHYVPVAGMMGSGKTTLSHALAEELNWTYLPESKRVTGHLADFFRDTKRWAFEVQTGFLCDKALEILKHLQSGVSFILDRSLQEDISIFAQYFYERGDIGEWNFETYQKLAEHFTSLIPKPTLTLFCACSFETLEKRIEFRGRDFERLYPRHHLEYMYKCYHDWLQLYRGDGLYTVNSEIFDFRDTQIAEGIARDVDNLIQFYDESSTDGHIHPALPTLKFIEPF
jgi:deoxyadenosine/deoxycytidine kinase